MYTQSLYQMSFVAAKLSMEEAEAPLSAAPAESVKSAHLAWRVTDGPPPASVLPNALAWSAHNLLALSNGAAIHFVSADAPQMIAGTARSDPALAAVESYVAALQPPFPSKKRLRDIWRLCDNPHNANAATKAAANAQLCERNVHYFRAVCWSPPVGSPPHCLLAAAIGHATVVYASPPAAERSLVWGRPTPLLLTPLLAKCLPPPRRAHLLEVHASSWSQCYYPPHPDGHHAPVSYLSLGGPSLLCVLSYVAPVPEQAPPVEPHSRAADEEAPPAGWAIALRLPVSAPITCLHWGSNGGGQASVGHAPCVGHAPRIPAAAGSAISAISTSELPPTDLQLFAGDAHGTVRYFRVAPHMPSELRCIGTMQICLGDFWPIRSLSSAPVYGGDGGEHAVLLASGFHSRLYRTQLPPPDEQGGVVPEGREEEGGRGGAGGSHSLMYVSTLTS